MKILLHICCGVCAASVAEKLMCEGHTVTGFFYNPNIHPVDEYKKRLIVARKVSERYGFDLVEAIYDRENWFPLVKGKEYEREGGQRCRISFRMRLEKTYEYFKKKEIFDTFTTTLTVSPMKDAPAINKIGMEIGGERFLCADFKKKDGFKRTMEVAEEMGLYRQHYCGCIYSLEEKLARDNKREKN